MTRITVTVREGPVFHRHRCAELDAAIEIVREEARRLSEGAHARPAHLLAHKLEPVEQVVGRVQLSVAAGRLRRGRTVGVDVRGDGSLEAYSGGVTRRVVEARPGEDAFAALRRSLTDPD